MKKVLVFLGFVCVMFGILLGVYFSGIGNNFLKKYIVSKICYKVNLKPVLFNHSFNSFSLVLKNNNSVIQIFGQIFPFKATYNANIGDIGMFYKGLKGKVISMGEIEKSKIIGDVFAAKGKGKVNFEWKNNCLNIVKGEIKGKNFDTASFLKMFKNIDLKNLSLSGVNDLDVVFKSYNTGELKSTFHGILNLLDNNLSVTIDSVFKFNAKLFNYKAEIKGKDIKGEVITQKGKNGIKYLGKFKQFNLSILKKITLIPFSKKVYLNVIYDTINKVYNFQSTYFGGYYKNNKLVVQFSMPSEKFFDFLSIPTLINGQVVGSFHINKKNGNFDILIENASFNKKVFKKLKKLIKLKYNPNDKGKIFISGNFNREKLVFNLISKDLDAFWSIKNGVFYFNGKYSFILKLDTGKKIYFFRMKNNYIKLIKVINNNQTIETLVF